MGARHMKKIRNTHNTTPDSRKTFIGNIATVIVSIVFLGVSYFLVFKTHQLLYQIFGYVFLIWGVMGIAHVLKETLMSIWRANFNS